jgi:hypothetical protein
VQESLSLKREDQGRQEPCQSPNPVNIGSDKKPVKSHRPFEENHPVSQAAKSQTTKRL